MRSCYFRSSVRILVAVVVCYIAAMEAAPASDKAREMEIADDILESLVVGETVWLEAGRQKFLGLLTEAATKKPHGAVLLLHEAGLNPNSSRVIKPLRTGLAELGWTTLSIQMPIPEDEEDYDSYNRLMPEAVERISFALEVLTEKDYENISLIGHSFGASVAINYLAGSGAEKVMASVAVGLAVPTEKSRKAKMLQNLAKVKIPMLDIFGSRDVVGVRGSAKQRKLAAKNNLVYRQMKIYGADHQFAHMESVLLKRIYSWLKNRSKRGASNANVDRALPFLQITMRKNDAPNQSQKYF